MASIRWSRCTARTCRCCRSSTTAGSAADRVGVRALCGRCFSAGDRVKHWITINEPRVHAVYGYARDHAPGRSSDPTREPRIALHYMLLAHARGHALQARVPGRSIISLAMNSDCASRWAARRPTWRRRSARWSSASAGSPTRSTLATTPRRCARIGNRLRSFTPEQSRLLLNSTDFFALQHYSTMLVSEQPDGELPDTNFYADEGIRPRRPRRGMLGWDIAPFGYRLIKWSKAGTRPRAASSSPRAACPRPMRRRRSHAVSRRPRPRCPSSRAPCATRVAPVWVPRPCVVPCASVWLMVFRGVTSDDVERQCYIADRSRSRARSRRASTCAATSTGRSPTTSSGPRATARASASCTSSTTAAPLAGLRRPLRAAVAVARVHLLGECVQRVGGGGAALKHESAELQRLMNATLDPKQELLRLQQISLRAQRLAKLAAMQATYDAEQGDFELMRFWGGRAKRMQAAAEQQRKRLVQEVKTHKQRLQQAELAAAAEGGAVAGGAAAPMPEEAAQMAAAKAAMDVAPVGQRAPEVAAEAVAEEAEIERRMSEEMQLPEGEQSQGGAGGGAAADAAGAAGVAKQLSSEGEFGTEDDVSAQAGRRRCRWGGGRFGRGGGDGCGRRRPRSGGAAGAMDGGGAERRVESASSDEEMEASEAAMVPIEEARWRRRCCRWPMAGCPAGLRAWYVACSTPYVRSSGV